MNAITLLTIVFAMIGSVIAFYVYQCLVFKYNASRCNEAKPREDYFETCTQRMDISAHQQMSEAIIECRMPNLKFKFGHSIEKEVKRTKQSRRTKQIRCGEKEWLSK